MLQWFVKTVPMTRIVSLILTDLREEIVPEERNGIKGNVDKVGEYLQPYFFARLLFQLLLRISSRDFVGIICMADIEQIIPDPDTAVSDRIK